MNNLPRKVQIFLARSFEEAKLIEQSQDKITLRSFLLRSFIKLWVLGVNILLWTVKRVFFRNSSYSLHGLKNIVVYTVGTIGDNVLVLPAIAAIKRQYP